jgi:hypothetical protein
VAAGVAFIATAGVAYADPATTEADKKDVPWYERFTLGATSKDNVSRVGPAADNGVRWAPSSRVGVTFGVQNRDRSTVADRERVEAGVTYSFTPSVSVGGQVTFSSDPGRDFSRTRPDGGDAGVKVQSRFRF